MSERAETPRTAYAPLPSLPLSSSGLFQGSRARTGELPTHIEELIGWPQRIVAAIGTNLKPSTEHVLERFGFAAVRVHPSSSPGVVETIGPCTFLALDADAFASPAIGDLVRAFREFSPLAPTILFDRGRDPRSATLLAALRAGVTDVIDPDDEVSLAEALADHLKIAGRNRERVLAIGAHPDDIEIGCAGALLNHRRRGDRISMLTLSRGAVGGDTEDRVDEAVSSAQAIGAQLLMSDLADTRIGDGIDTIRIIESVVEALDPTIVYVHSAHDQHQDHRAVFAAALSATRGIPQVFGYQSPSASSEFRPTKFVPIDDVVNDKVRVLGMFASQASRTYLDPDFVVAGTQYWGRQLAPRARHAEPFEVIRTTGSHRAHPNVFADEHPSHSLASVTRLRAGRLTP